VGEEKKGKEELGKVNEEEFMANLEKWINKCESSFGVAFLHP